jgi:hypothetical protein
LQIGLHGFFLSLEIFNVFFICRVSVVCKRSVLHFFYFEKFLNFKPTILYGFIIFITVIRRKIFGIYSVSRIINTEFYHLQNSAIVFVKKQIEWIRPRWNRDCASDNREVDISSTTLRRKHFTTLAFFISAIRFMWMPPRTRVSSFSKTYSVGRP